MRLSGIPFEKIVSGQKTIESRLLDEKRQKIKIGDFIEFTQNDDETKKIMTKVVDLYFYKTFDEMFSDLPSADFGGASKKKLLKEIEQFYPLEEQNKFGVVGIKIMKE
jgi:ASC-1-like (ASCH) protein